jgi:signal peptidase I
MARARASYRRFAAAIDEPFAQIGYDGPCAMRKWFKGLLWVAALLGLFAAILRATVLKAWTLPDDPVLSASVSPTMSGGDTVLLLTRGTPGFGDLVRCTDPQDQTKFVVGRIVGVEGDVVETQGSNLFVNGKTYQAESACAKPTFTIAQPSNGNEVVLNCDVVSMGGGWHYRGIAAKPTHASKARSEVTSGMVYLLSDDREFHDDSRDFGPIPRTSCKDRPFFRLWGKAGWSDEAHRLVYLH